MIREPAVAGQFYRGSKEELKEQIASYVTKPKKKQEALAAMSPHAGYVYSGPVAGALFSEIEITDTVIILGPNHTGAGARFSLYKKGSWRTPLGEAAIDFELANAIEKGSDLIKADALAHACEHSIEVQVPFLQYLNSEVKIVPIVIGSADPGEYRGVANAIISALKANKRRALIVASSDMTHYESHEQARRKDSQAIDAILKLDENLLLKKVSEYNISMCGIAPATVMLMAAKALGASEAKLIKYQTSGDISGDYSAVVGYAGVVIR